MNQNAKSESLVLALDLINVLALHNETVEKLGELREEMGIVAGWLDKGRTSLSRHKVISRNSHSQAALSSLLAGVSGLLKAGGGELKYMTDLMEKTAKETKSNSKRGKG